MVLLNREDEELQKARQALMDNLGRNCDRERMSGGENDEGEETTIFEKGDVCVELSSKGGLFVRPSKGDGGQTRYYFSAGFGGRAAWQMAKEIDRYVLYHTTFAQGVSANTLKETLQNKSNGEFVLTSIGRHELFEICSTSDDNAFEQIIKFALLVDEARTPNHRVNPPLPTRGGCDPGPSGGGERSGAIWEAKQHPLTLKIAAHLNKLGWTAALNPGNWRPDIFFERCGSPFLGKILIEVKPDNGTHNVITAIGQLLCYSLPLDNLQVILVLATKGEVEINLAKTLEERYAINALDLAKGDWTAKLDALCGSATP